MALAAGTGVRVPSIASVCQQCGSPLPPMLPGVIAVQCLHCGTSYVGDGGHARPTQAAAVSARAARAQGPIEAQHALDALQDRLRATRRELDAVKDKLAQRSFFKSAASNVIWIGLALFLIGWIPVSSSRTVPADTHTPYIELLARARAARLADGSIPVTLVRAGKEVVVSVRNERIFTSGTTEEKQFLATPVTMVENAGDATSSEEAAAYPGWKLSGIEVGSGPDAEGLMNGDVILRVGGSEVPSADGEDKVVSVPIHPYGYLPLKIVGMLTLAVGLWLHRLRSARARRLRLVEHALEQQIDAALHRGN